MTRLFKTTLIAGLALFFLFFAQSCTIKEEVYFNEDMSGNRSVSIDMSQMMMFMEMMGDEMSDEEGGDEKGEDKDDMMQGFKDGLEEGGEIDSLLDAMNAKEGLSNAFMTVDTNSFKLSLGYDFDNLDALNLSYDQTSDAGDNFGGAIPAPNDGKKKDKSKDKSPTFRMEGKTLIFNDATFDMYDEAADRSEEDAGMGALGNMLDYEVTLHFKSEVKSADGLNVSVVDAHTVTAAYTMSDLESTKNASRITVKFK